MIAKLRAVLKELGNPSAQKDQWFSWASAQMAHSFIGFAIAGNLTPFVAPWVALLGTALGYGLGKEIADFRREPSWATARDCVQDTLFVTSGAALAVSLAGENSVLFLVVVLVTLVGLWLGVSDRIEDTSK